MGGDRRDNVKMEKELVELKVETLMVVEAVVEW